MWIFTPQGFISAVAHREDPQSIMIRARDQGHLRAMFPGSTVVKSPLGDYPARISIPRNVFAAWLASQAYDLDYTNFKDAIPYEDRTYHDACVAVWEDMHALETEDGRD